MQIQPIQANAQSRTQHAVATPQTVESSREPSTQYESTQDRRAQARHHEIPASGQPLPAVAPHPSPVPLTPSGRLGRQIVKRAMYSQMILGQAAGVLTGRTQPLVRFRVESDPPSSFYNLRLRADKLDAFKAALSLPQGFELVPMACLEGDKPEYLISLNVYRVSGITNGLRAEWSVYVDDGSGKPRFMVIDARASNVSMDPVDVLTPASKLEHGVDEGAVSTTIGPSNARFSASFELPKEGQPKHLPNRAWIEANDYIYWRNGICDRAYYDGSFFNSRLWSIAPESVRIHDESPWAQFVEPQPYQVLVFDDAMDLVLSPWWNVDEKPPKPESRP